MVKVRDIPITIDGKSTEVSVLESAKRKRGIITVPGIGTVSQDFPLCVSDSTIAGELVREVMLYDRFR